MVENRGEFSSKFGFIMAAAGSAVGLGNIWSFPTQTANHGGAAFLLVYLILAFCLAYPALMAELIIGRYTKANAASALKAIANTNNGQRFGFLVGFTGVLVASLILSFYGIVAGWMFSYFLEPIARLAGLTSLADWLINQSIQRSILFTLLFMGMNIHIITGGVKDGIEKWSSRLMPIMIVLMLALIVYVLTQQGAMQGLAAYLIPDLSRINPTLVIRALGQAFFSLSLGVGTMLIYGSYIQKKENLPLLGVQVTLLDVGIAFIAGLLVIPAMYVAQHNGVQIFAADGTLQESTSLVFTVLPALFNSMGGIGLLVALVFFALMTIAALTSSISMLEVPVSFAVEYKNIPRKKATWLIGAGILLFSILIIVKQALLFGLVITLTTVYSQPILAIFFCVFCGWIWHRHKILQELRHGFPEIEQSFFWKIWPFYIKYLCPLGILLVFVQSIV